MESKLDAKAVAKAIKIPTKKWVGNCFGIAQALVEAGLVKGTAVYGHWVGPIARTSHFADRRAVGFTNHGWVLLEDGETVVDPTRWVFEARDPYIFIGKKELECFDFESEDGLDYCCMHCGHTIEEHKDGFFRSCLICKWPYDEGGNELRSRMGKPPPDYDPEEPSFRIEKRLSPAARKIVDGLFDKAKRKKGLLSKMQCHWLATQPYENYGGAVKEIYDALIAEKLAGLIPLDNRQRAEREAKRSKERKTA
jgi:hypothetical protein